jgi:drug/metabolite transporter (DMT)-like permease
MKDYDSALLLSPDSPRGLARPLLLVAYVAVCVIWGSTYLAVRVAVESYPPFLVACVRCLVAGGLLYAIARRRGEGAPSRAQWAWATATGAMLFVVGNGFVNVAERSVSSGLASVLVSTMPLWSTLFVRLLGERVSPRELVGVVVGLVGVGILNLGGELRASPGGALFALLAPVGWALGSIATQRSPLPRGAMRAATQMLGGGAALFFVSVAAGENLGQVPSARSFFAIVYLTIFGSLVAFTAFSYLLQYARPALATSYVYVNPVIAVALGMMFAGEPLGTTSFLGAAIVLGAVVLVAVAPAPRYSAAKSSTVKAV